MLNNKLKRGKGSTIVKILCKQEKILRYIVPLMLFLLTMYCIFIYINGPIIKLNILESKNEYEFSNELELNRSIPFFRNDNEQIIEKYLFYLYNLRNYILNRKIFFNINSNTSIYLCLKYRHNNITSIIEFNNVTNVIKEHVLEKNSSMAYLFIIFPQNTNYKIKLTTTEVCIINELNYNISFFYAKLSAILGILFLLIIKILNLTPDLFFINISYYSTPKKYLNYRKEYIIQEKKLPDLFYFITSLITLIVILYPILFYKIYIESSYNERPYLFNIFIDQSISFCYTVFFYIIITMYIVFFIIIFTSNLLSIFLNIKIFDNVDDYNKLVMAEGELFNDFLRSKKTKITFILWILYSIIFLLIYTQYYYITAKVIQFLLYIISIPLLIYFSNFFTYMIFEQMKSHDFEKVTTRLKGTINSYFFGGIIVYITFILTSKTILNYICQIFILRGPVRNIKYTNTNSIFIIYDLIENFIKPLGMGFPFLLLIFYWLVSTLIYFKVPKKYEKTYKSKFKRSFFLSILTLIFTIILSFIYTPMNELYVLIQSAFITGMCEDYLEVIFKK